MPRATPRLLGHPNKSSRFCWYSQTDYSFTLRLLYAIFVLGVAISGSVDRDCATGLTSVLQAASSKPLPYYHGSSLRIVNVFLRRGCLLQWSFSKLHSMISLLNMPNDQSEADLSPFHSVTHVPPSSDGHISILRRAGGKVRRENSETSSKARSSAVTTSR